MRRLNWKLPLLLYLATWLTTSGFRLPTDLSFFSGIPYQLVYAGTLSLVEGRWNAEAWSALGSMIRTGLAYSVPLMLILTCHEFGHYIQTRRYGVSSSLPYFIPMPFGPFGTLGAVIAMDGRIPNTRALFDIGISGPLAGLVPTLVCLYYGIKWSFLGPIVGGSEMQFGEPLLFQHMTRLLYGPMPPDVTLYAHPVALAGWVGLFLTSLNLLPFSQLDGGHIFYALLGRRAARLSWAFFYLIILLVVAFQLWHWMLVLILLAMIGVAHPPTANDAMPLTPLRRALGWATLSFVLVGLTPTPITINDAPPRARPPKLYCDATFEAPDSGPPGHDDSVLTFRRSGV